MLEADYNLYFNALFGFMLLTGIFFGYWRGFKKTAYGLITKVIFIAFFFITLNSAVSFLWNYEIPELYGFLSGVDQQFENVSKTSEIVPVIIDVFLSEQLGTTASNENLIEFANAIVLFGLKIIYALIYFTIIALIYKIITYIAGKIIIREKKTNKKRLAGALVGGFSGIASIFLSLILLGGFVNISSSIIQMADTTQSEGQNSSETLQQTSGEEQLIPGLEESLYEMTNFIDAYNQNAFISFFNSLTYSESGTTHEVPLHVALFDQIFSLEYQEEKINLRREIEVFSNVGSFVYSLQEEDENLNDINTDELRISIEELSNSRLLVAMLPLGIEIASGQMGFEMDLENENIYEWDWSEEVRRTGVIFASVLEITIAAGVFEENIELVDAQFSGSEIEKIFNEASEMNTFTNDKIIQGIFARVGEEQLGNLPENIDWSDEFKSIGSILSDVADTNITVRDIQELNLNNTLNKMQAFDFETIIDSHILEELLINTLKDEGFSENETIKIPDDLSWRDNDAEDGELRILLRSLNAITAEPSDFNFDELDVSYLLNIEEETFEKILESRILGITIGRQIYEFGNQEDVLMFPKTTLSSTQVNGIDTEYLVSNEILSLINAMKTVNIENFETIETNPVFLKDIENIESLLESKILHATFSKYIIDFDRNLETISVPEYTFENEIVVFYDNDDEIEYLNKGEISDFVNAVLSLDVLEGDLDIGEIGLSVFQDNLGDVLQSSIIHYTVSDYLYGVDGIKIPIEDETGAKTIVSTNNEEQSYIAPDELTILFDAFVSLGYGGFEGVSFGAQDVLNIGDFESILESASIRLTISDFILPNALDETEFPSTETNLFITSALRTTMETTEGSSEVIIKDELFELITSLKTIGLDFNGSMDPSLINNVSDEIETILESASMHITIDNMIKQNPIIDIPDLAIKDEIFYNVSDVLKASEMENFIKATSVFSESTNSGETFEDISFDLSRINELEAGKRNEILSSMIVRNVLTEQVENLLDNQGQTPENYFESTDYEENNRNNFLRKESIENFLDDFDSFL